MKQLLIILFIFFPATSYCQSDNVQFKVAPLSAIDDASFPAITAGIEVRLSEYFSWYNEFGWKYRNSLYENTDTSFISSSGYRIKTEVRYYAPWHKRKARIMDEDEPLTGFYLGLNGFFQRDNYNEQIY